MTEFFDFIAANAWKAILPIMGAGAAIVFGVMFWLGMFPGPVEMLMTLAVMVAIVWMSSSAWNFMPDTTEEPKPLEEDKL